MAENVSLEFLNVLFGFEKYIKIKLTKKKKK
jgi:hypothetical protein